MKLLSLIILVLLPFSGGAAVTDLKSAEEYVNASARFPVEGLWRDTDDRCTVLIMHSASLGSVNGSYDIIMMQDDNGMTAPGTLIGTAAPTASPDKFRVEYAGSFRKFAASLSKDNNFLTLESDRIEATLHPLALLPRLRRIVSIRIRRPASDLPKGYVRICPRPQVSPVRL